VHVVGHLPEPLSDLVAVALGQRVVLAGGRSSAGHPHSAILSATLG
jgi:hypothetical protein